MSTRTITSTSSGSNATDGSATPPAADPSNALKVAIMFVKQYYKCLSSHPEMLERFYSPNQSSYLSHGEGSEPTEPSPFHSTNHGHDRWGCCNSNSTDSFNEKMLFEFEDGAIDAQPSQNEGILMVVTASVIFRSAGAETMKERRKQFVQTFFLAKIGRNFAVTNDILRFLAVSNVVEDIAGVEPEVVLASVNANANVNANKNAIDESSTKTPEPKETAAAVETTATASPTATTTTALVQDKKKADTALEEKTGSSGDESSAPGRGVEESKVEAPLEEEAAAASATDASKKRSSSKENKGKKNKGGKQQQQQQQQQQKPAAPKPPPGSWASLVVSGGSAPNTPIRTQEKKVNKAVSARQQQPPLPPSVDSSESKDNSNADSSSESQKKAQEKATTKTNTTNSSNAKNDKSSNNKTNKDNSNNKERTKRDPDNTLVIKNLSENIKEQDILNMFSPFAAMTKSKIVGTNLNHHRMLAFVDYDSVAPVNAALKKHKETPFEWNGKVLEVDQKTLEQRARRKAGGNNNQNSNSNSNSNQNNNSSSNQNSSSSSNSNQNNNSNTNNGYRSANAGGAGRGGNNKYNNNGRGDGASGGRRRGTRAGR